MNVTRLRRAGVLVAATAIAVFGLAGAAFAHVTISPGTAPQGGFTVVTFRVPTESDTALTTSVQVFMDLTHPLAVVDVQPVPGWTATVHTKKLSTPIKDDDGNEVDSAISDVLWTADSAATAIKPGGFQQFPLELGPLPNIPAYTFKALQTYSDKSVVSWIDQQQPGQPEPDHPAPVLTLTPAAGDTTTAATTPAGTGVTATAAAASTGGGGGGSGKTWGIIGTLLGAIGVILGGAAYARSRSAATPPTS